MDPNSDNHYSFKEFEERNRGLINEILVPIGLVIALVISLWVASQ